jgi:hypothetical protein
VLEVPEPAPKDAVDVGNDARFRGSSRYHERARGVSEKRKLGN